MSASGLHKLKIIWCSAGMHLNTGYGKVTRNVVTRLVKNFGLDIICFNPHIYGAPIYIDGILQLPKMGHDFGADVVPIYYRVYNRNLLITLWDVWVLHWVRNHALNWVPYVPIDAPLDEWTIEINEPLNYPQCIAIIAMSRFGEEQIRKVVRDKPIFYIPHGVDTKLYKPMDKRQCRKELGFEEDVFIFGYVALNIGDRKDFPCLIKAFRIFLDSNPDARKDARLLLWTNFEPCLGRSFDIARICRRYGLSDLVYFPTMQPPNLWYGEDVMVRIYNAMDWYISTSRGEGFGLPLLEAQACGVPCIAPDNSAQRELVEGRGILVKPRYTTYTLCTPTHQEYAVCDPHDVADAMAKAYNMGVPDSLREKCREFALHYDWEIIVHKWLEVLGKVADML